jgi:hypothetical protein
MKSGKLTAITKKNVSEFCWNFKVFNQDFIDNNVYAGAKIASSNLKITMIFVSGCFC